MRRYVGTKEKRAQRDRNGRYGNPGTGGTYADAAADFERLYDIVEPLYSEDEGWRSIDPVVLFKLVTV